MSHEQSASTRSMPLRSFQEPCQTVSEEHLMKVWNSSATHTDRTTYQDPLGSDVSASGEG